MNGNPSASGGGARQQQHSNIEKVVRAQVYFILSTIREDQYDVKVKQLEQLISQNGGEIYLHFLRRLIIANANRIPDIQKTSNSSLNGTVSASGTTTSFSGSSLPSSKSSGIPIASVGQTGSADMATVRLLTEQMHLISSLPSKAIQFGEAIAFAESEFFRTFNLIGFLKYFNLTPTQEMVLATSSALYRNPDLAEQAMTIVKLNFASFVENIHRIAFMRNPDELQLLTKELAMSQTQTIQKILQNIEFPADLNVYRSSTLVSVIENNSYADFKDSQQLLHLFQRSLSPQHRPTSNDIAQLIIYIAMNCDLEKWNLLVVVKALKQFCELNLSQILESLDCSNFFIDNFRSLAVFLELLSLIAETKNDKFNLSVLLKPWKHLNSQAALLEQLLINLKKEDLSALGLMERPIVALHDFDSATTSVRNKAFDVLSSVFNSFDIVKKIVLLIPTSAQNYALRILDLALQSAPELVFLGVLQQGEPWNEAQEAIVTRCIKIFFQGNKGYLVAFYYMSKICPDILSGIFRDIWTSDRKTAPRLVSICQEIGILDNLFNASPLFFAFEIVSHASTRGFVNVSQWLNQKYSSLSSNEARESFQLACMEFLSAKASAEASQNSIEPIHEAELLRVDIVDAFLQFLMSLNLSAATEENLKFVRIACLQVYPRLFSLGLGKDFMVIANTENRGFPPDVERQVENDYQRLYEHGLSVNDVILRLQKLRSSDNRSDLDIYSCMLHSLFDEYRFFSDYPISALAITAVLFGSLLQYGLLTSIPSAVALGCIYDSLLESTDHNMYRFGVQALIQFQQRLPQFPKFVQKILGIPNLAVTNPSIMESIKVIIQSRPRSPCTDGNMEKLTSTFSSLQPEPLPHHLAYYKTPDDSTQDQILFAINNLSTSNFDSKTKEIMRTLIPQYYRWFSNYIVLKRASCEPNFHGLYIQFLDVLKDKDLMKHIVCETIASVISLLNSEKLKMSPVERASLKNLGSWLGAITLARNKIIKHKNIAFKSLIIEGYYTDRTNVVLPFVCKVLEQTAYSVVFKPSNPWLLGIIKLLAELYNYADLKLNLKFEIDVLCRNIGIDINTVTPSKLLQIQQPAEYSNIDKPIDLPNNGHHADPIQDPDAYNLEPLAPSPIDTSLEQYLSELIDKLLISPKVVFHHDISSSALRKMLLMAIGQSFNDVVIPVVDRVSNIATVASTELILKDFAKERNINLLRTAAKNLAQTFAANLCVVNCREPLQISLVSNVKALLLQIPGIDENMISLESIEQMVDDNIHLAISIAEKYATEKAFINIDKALASAYHERMAFNKINPTGVPFESSHISATMRAQQYSLPPVLALEPLGLSSEQKRVYESFDKTKPVESVRSMASAGTKETSENSQFNDGQSVDRELIRNIQHMKLHDEDIARQSKPGQDVFTNILIDKSQQILRELKNVLLNSNFTNMKDIPADHDLQTALYTLANMISELSMINRDDILLFLAQAITALMISPKLRDLQLASEIFLTILDRMRTISPSVLQFISSFFLKSSDVDKLYVPVYSHLIRASFFSASDLDVELAKGIRAHDATFIRFSIDLIRNTVLTDHPDALLSEFAETIEALNDLKSDGASSLPEEVLKHRSNLMRDICPEIPSVQHLITKIEEDEDVLKEQFGYMFAEWIRISQRTTRKKYYQSFVQQLRSIHIFDDPKVWLFLVKISFELSLDAYKKHIALNNGNTNSQCYIPIDAMTKLIMTIVLFDHANESESSETDNLNYVVLQQALMFSILLLAREHELRQDDNKFDQRLFCRFISSLIWTISIEEPNLKRSSVEKLHSIVVQTLVALQPAIFPGFTFAWLSLISHPKLLPSLMKTDTGRQYILEFIILLLKFLCSLFESSEIQTSISARLILKGFVRIVLVLSVDFPDFITLNYLQIVQHIPKQCPQLCNIILTIAPFNTSVGLNPFQKPPSLDNSPAGMIEPVIHVNFIKNLGQEMKNKLDDLLGMSTLSSSDLNGLHEDILEKHRQDGTNSVGNNLILYIAMHALLQNKQNPEYNLARFDPSSTEVKIVQGLLTIMRAKDRYLLLTGIMNHLRFPNCHTLWCLQLFLYLWISSSSSDISLQEMIARIILERLIPHQPHPWGLLVLFYFLLQDPSYQFWSRPFLADNRQICKVFDSIQEHMMRGDAHISSNSANDIETQPIKA